MNYFRNRLRHWFNEIRNSMGLLNAFFEEAMRGIDTIQSFLVMPITISRFRKLHDRYLHATIRNNLYDCFLFGAMEALMSLAIAWLLFHGIHIYQGRFWFGPTAPLTLGTLVAFVEYSQKLFMPLKEFSGKMAVIQRSQVSLQRLRQVLEDHEELVPGSQKLATGNACVIRADRLSFRYQKSMTPALDDVTFTIRTGEMTALVGETGSGKTSITRLITRQYDGYDGSLTMNGCEVRDIELTNIRDNIAIVQQDPIVFTASLFDNVRLFKEHISEAQVQHALKRIHCEPWVNALPQGIHTLVGAQGVQLSAGQTQLLQLARLFVFPARLVVMDEATSQVDTLTEELIQRALAEVFRSFTSIVVAHRLSTILHANNILVLKNARLVEQGTHAHLLAANGTYASLYRKQFEEHAPPDAAESTSAVPLSQGR
jgi:ATP-binding cassette subfamily B protein